MLGDRKLYEVTYFDGTPTLFVISQSRHGRAFTRVGFIDLRSEMKPANVEAASYLAKIMAQDSHIFCRGSRRDRLARRYELQANHFFNRSHPRFRGK